MTDSLVALNVGGVRFCTSRETLLSIPGTFFSSLISERIPSARDESGAIFIDRDPTLFSIILNYLRTKRLDLRGQSMYSVQTEAEFFGIQPLVRMLQLVEDHGRSTCGDILFHAYLQPPSFDVVGDEGATSSSWDNNMARFMAAPTRSSVDSDPVFRIIGHQNWLAATYTHRVCCYRRKESFGWELVFVSPLLQRPAHQIAFNSKVSIGNNQIKRLLAVASGGIICVWDITAPDAASAEITQHDFASTVDSLLFIGPQLVALSSVGKVAVWNLMTRHWKVQQVTPITSHDTAGSSLLLGCANGKIHYIDMEKFPLRMKDNDLLVTQLYQDPAKEAVTALSVYFTPKMCTIGHWLEIAYGTASGTVRVIVEHPETLGQGFQLLHTFTVHRSPVVRVMLGEKHLISVCSDCNHVRTWTVTRFRGCLSTQPGSQPLASFNVMSLEGVIGNDGLSPSAAARDIGPFGDHDDQQVFLQSVVPESNELYIRLSSTGKRLCVLRPVDSSNITAHCVHEFEGGSRIGSRSRRYVVTGQSNGSIQMFDLTTAVEHGRAIQAPNEMIGFDVSGGPNQSEFLASLEQLELRTTSSLLSSRATSERSLAGSLRFHHASSPSPQCAHHGMAYPGLRGSGRGNPAASHTPASQQRQQQSPEKQQQQQADAGASDASAEASAENSASPPPAGAASSAAQAAETSDDADTASSEASPPADHLVVRYSRSSFLSDTAGQKSPPPSSSLQQEQQQQQQQQPRGRSATLSGLPSSSGSSDSVASRAAMMQDAPFGGGTPHSGASNISMPLLLGSQPPPPSSSSALHDHSPTSHATTSSAAAAAAATAAACTSHRRSMSMSAGACASASSASKRSPPSQQSSSGVRLSLSAGEVSAPITRSSELSSAVVSSSMASSMSTGSRLASASSAQSGASASAQWQAAHLARFGSLPTASALDERGSYISHC